LERTDAFVYFWGPAERNRFDGLSEKVRDRLTEYNDRWYRVARKAGLRGVRLELGRVCPSMADRWGVSESTWHNDLVRASDVDPAKLTEAAHRIVKRVHRGKTLHITHSNGTDLTVSLMGAKPRTTNGRPAEGKRRGAFGMMVSVPAGTVLTALDHKVGTGRLIANRPSFLERSRTEGADWRFEDGRLKEYSFAYGEKHFEDAYGGASKGRDRPGMVSFGLNPESKALPSVEDTENGVVLISVGGNGFAGGNNPSDGFSWAMLGGANVELDGKPFLEDGRFV
jgi:hypothetical protein